MSGVYLFPAQVHTAHVESGEGIGHHQDGDWQQQDSDEVSCVLSDRP